MNLSAIFAPTSLLGSALLAVGVGLEVKNSISGPVKPVEVAVVEPVPAKVETPLPAPKVVVPAPAPPPKVVVPPPAPELTPPPVPPLKAVPIPASKLPHTVPPPIPFEIPEDLLKRYFPTVKNPMGPDSVKPTLEIIVSIQRSLTKITQKILPVRAELTNLGLKVEAMRKEYRDEVKGINGKPGIGPKARAIDAKLKPLEQSFSSKQRAVISMEEERDGLIELLGTLTRKLGIPVIGEVSEKDLETLLGNIEVISVSTKLSKRLHQSLVAISQGVEEISMDDVDGERSQPKRSATIKPGAKIPVAIVEAIDATTSSRDAKIQDQLKKVSPNTVKLTGRVAKFPTPKLVNGYDKPFPESEKTGALAGGEFFGGIRAKTYYKGATGSVFSHMAKYKDTGDNGKSFWRFLTGARLGKDGQVIHHNEGVALPPQIFELVGPASDVEIWIKNIDKNCGVVCPIVDVGPANRIWRLIGGPVIDMTPTTAVALGATIHVSKTSIRGVGGVRNNLEFEVVKRGQKPKHIRF